jgi:hypothetical protein
MNDNGQPKESAKGAEIRPALAPFFEATAKSPGTDAVSDDEH